MFSKLLNFFVNGHVNEQKKSPEVNVDGEKRTNQEQNI